MRRLVIDANIAAKWYLPEIDSVLAERLLDLNAEFHAPDFLKIEFASIIWKHAMAGNVSSEIWDTVQEQLDSVIPNWHRHEKLLDGALKLAFSSRHHVFDCLYLALAIEIDGIVISADKQFIARFEGTQFANRIVTMQSALT